jgi:hypothetical protein
MATTKGILRPQSRNLVDSSSSQAVSVGHLVGLEAVSEGYNPGDASTPTRVQLRPC